jgi:hypothetical protein
MNSSSLNLVSQMRCSNWGQRVLNQRGRPKELKIIHVPGERSPQVNEGQRHGYLVTDYSHLSFKVKMAEALISAPFIESQGRDDVSKVTQRSKARNCIGRAIQGEDKSRRSKVGTERYSGGTDAHGSEGLPDRPRRHLQHTGLADQLIPHGFSSDSGL